MEVVAAAPNGGGVPPFHDHDVREWSRIDSITGALERARLETDHWSANTLNSSQKYGKVVDSRARTGADGALQQQARRQLEVFQSQIPGGHVQVIKSHTVSSSRWSSKSLAGDGGGFSTNKGFENLQLSLNPLDISSQKSKAIVGRSVSRRPPTRQRPRETTTTPADPLKDVHITAAANLHRVSRLCHQVHETAVRQAFGNKRSSPKPSISDRQSGDGSVEIYEIESVSSNGTKSLNGHGSNLTQTKSTSSEDIHVIPEKDSSTKSVEDLEDLEQLQNWRRTSKIRRSLQFPKQNKTVNSSKPLDLPENSVSVKKIREDLEKGRRLNTALRNNSVDLEALDQILQSISSTSSIHSDRTSDREDSELDQQASQKKKRNSFVTVESIQEVKGRLRRTSSPTSDIYKVNGDKEEDPDDGIVTEDTKEMPVMEKSAVQSRVRSYVYGMETMLNKKPGLGTGSLESRIKLVNGASSNRNEDWYNRRKSYGFEQVHGHENTNASISNKNKNLVESSTDSGICRSTEIVLVPQATKTSFEYNDNTNSYNSDNNSDCDQNYPNGLDKTEKESAFGKVKKTANVFNNETTTHFYDRSHNELTNLWNKKTTYNTDSDWSRLKPEIKSTTITIPIIKNNNVVDLSWNDEPVKDNKRHSIAVDESKYIIKSANDSKYRRTSLALNDQLTSQEEEDPNSNRKPKKVEFCKTEVHFAADSGKVNIVTTDEKPPPTQNFRRRRRNSGPSVEDFNKNGMPILHFGDSSYEKTMFGVTDSDTLSIYENLPRMPTNLGTVTVNTGINSDFLKDEEEEKKDLDNDSIKGILKNRMIKPKPYHLGETMLFSESSLDENEKWGVRLRHVEKDVPIWKSTVTMQNYYDKQPWKSTTNNSDEQPEFQRLLRNLRPTKRSDSVSDNESSYPDSFSSIKVIPVMDKMTEENQLNESRGYSTKVNFGDGKTTVIEQDGFNKNNRHTTWPPSETSSKVSVIEDSHIEATRSEKNDISKTSSKYPVNLVRNNQSPITLRKAGPITSRSDLKIAFTKDKLNSSSLIGKNKNYEYTESIDHSVSGLSRSPEKELRHTPDKSQKKYASDGVVLRQPRKSEMAYFGVNVSPKPVKKISQAVIRKENKLSEKPDLLQHYKKSPSPTRKTKTNVKVKPRHKSPLAKADEGHIYENVKDSSDRFTKEFDSSILDELTKAADQIMQAVNGYTDEDSHHRFSSDEEGTKRKNMRNKLDTISETKSWKNQTSTTKVRPLILNRSKIKQTTLNSSLESVSRRKITPSVEKKSQTKIGTEGQKKRAEVNIAKANTKARRLQRASSREALLQSHGSSSEDLPAKIEVPVRRARLVKKTKGIQLTVTNGFELKKKPNNSRMKEETKAPTLQSSGKTDERIMGSLPEIRHKTAVSTIRSTADKSTRDRSRHRSDTIKKKPLQKRETGRNVSSTNHMDKEKNIKTGSLNKETVTHRISTANIKKCHRSEGIMQH